jgi:hypothetical protein
MYIVTLLDFPKFIFNSEILFSSFLVSSQSYPEISPTFSIESE